MRVYVRNGYSLFCKKFLSKSGSSGHSFKDVSAAWHQLPVSKKNHYQRKADKVGHTAAWHQLPVSKKNHYQRKADKVGHTLPNDLMLILLSVPCYTLHWAGSN